MARAPEPMKLSGKAVMGRIIVLESFIVALGAAALPKDPEARESFIAELTKDAAARARNTGHEETQVETADYSRELIEAMIAASD